MPRAENHGELRERGNHARFVQHDVEPDRVRQLEPDHPAVVEGRTIFPTRVAGVDQAKRFLISGENNAKIGRVVTKGAWAGFPIFTLTLEERATCPRSCDQWRGCYGNAMHHPHRWDVADPLFLDTLRAEIITTARLHPEGFVVRLHVLGDFYSLDYVRMWVEMVDRFPQLHVYGYTARRPDADDEESRRIALALAWLTSQAPDQFAIRFSRADVAPGYAIVVDEPIEANNVVMCPAQVKATETCGTCALCWAPAARDKTIAFLRHGIKVRGPDGGVDRLQPPGAPAVAPPAKPAPVPAAPPARDPGLAPGYPMPLEEALQLIERVPNAKVGLSTKRAMVRAYLLEARPSPAIAAAAAVSRERVSQVLTEFGISREDRARREAAAKTGAMPTLVHPSETEEEREEEQPATIAWKGPKPAKETPRDVAAGDGDPLPAPPAAAAPGPGSAERAPPRDVAPGPRPGPVSVAPPRPAPPPAAAPAPKPPPKPPAPAPARVPEPAMKRVGGLKGLSSSSFVDEPAPKRRGNPNWGAGATRGPPLKGALPGEGKDERRARIMVFLEANPDLVDDDAAARAMGGGMPASAVFEARRVLSGRAAERARSAGVFLPPPAFTPTSAKVPPTPEARLAAVSEEEKARIAATYGAMFKPRATEAA